MPQKNFSGSSNEGQVDFSINQRNCGQKQPNFEQQDGNSSSSCNRLVVRSGLMDLHGNITQGSKKTPSSCSGSFQSYNRTKSSFNQQKAGVSNYQQKSSFSNNQLQSSFPSKQQSFSSSYNQQLSKNGNSNNTSGLLSSKSPYSSTGSDSIERNCERTYTPFKQQHSSNSKGYNSVQSQQQSSPKNTWPSKQNQFGMNATQQRSSVWSNDNKDQTKAKIKEKPRQVVDSSLRIMTCPISTVREWAVLKAAQGLTMFEIFGIVDSAVLKTKDGSGKEFMLKDDSSKIKCLFYEIDRELPKLIRGQCQVYRVIGTYDEYKDAVRVMSVRLAETGEQQLCYCATQASQNEMERLAGVLHEQ